MKLFTFALKQTRKNDYDFFLLLSLESSFDSNFIRSHACNNSSLQASRHQKVGLRGNSCWCLGFNCNVINHHVHNQTTICRIVIYYLKITNANHSFVFLNWLSTVVCFYFLHCSKISVWSGEIIIVWVDQIV